MILVRVRLISGRLNLTRRLVREIKTGSGPEGAIDPRAFRMPPRRCLGPYDPLAQRDTPLKLLHGAWRYQKVRMRIEPIYYSGTKLFRFNVIILSSFQSSGGG